MLGVNINEDNMIIRNINKEDIKYICQLYSNYNKYVYALGLNYKESIAEIQKSINSIDICGKSNAICIILHNDKKIGIIKVNLVNNKLYSMWINYILIDEFNQRKKAGSKVIDLIEKYFLKYFSINKIYISVVKSNKIGYEFWIHKKYIFQKVLKDHVIINNKNEDIIIMAKTIKSCK